MIIAVNFQFKQLERRSLRKSGLRRDSNPWPPRYRRDALPTELWNHILGARSIYRVHIFSCSEVMWSIYEIIHICTAVVDEVKSDHRNKFSNFKQLERRSLKKSRLQRDSNPWPPRYRRDALPTELWSHTLGARSIYWVHISREEWNDVKFIRNNSYIWTAVVDQSEEWSSQ